jgi:NAD(P)-dependent dehydrogenase (short-subunit alcohol dehydrogenase family)
MVRFRATERSFDWLSRRRECGGVKSRNGRLENRVAVITGAGAGIARAAATIFADEGSAIVVAELNGDTGSRAVEEIRAAGGNAIFVQTDATSDSSVEDLFSEVDRRFGALHVLYNCTGGSLTSDGIVSELDMDIFDKAITFDVRSCVLCSRAGIPRIKASGGGSVINMASYFALVGRDKLHAYTAAKGAIVSLTRAMAATYARDGIRVNAIAPGVAITERVASRGHDAWRKMRDSGEGVWGEHPFGVGEPVDIANIALFLASDESRMITGATLPADGGRSAY